ncbi:MAG: 50S ribosomal protein L32, partial [Planctomycetota bacterium]
HSQTRMGRSHDAIKGTHSVDCPNCGSPKLPHAACRDCGYVRPGLQLRVKSNDPD